MSTFDITLENTMVSRVIFTQKLNDFPFGDNCLSSKTLPILVRERRLLFPQRGQGGGLPALGRPTSA